MLSGIEQLNLGGAINKVIGASNVLTWNAAQILVNYGGTFVSHFGENSMLTIKPTTESFKEVVGTMLETDRIYSGIRSFEVRFVLKRVSPSNVDLSSFHNLDLHANIGGLRLLIKDLSGLTTFVSTFAYITQFPEWESTKRMGDVEWVLRTTSKTHLFLGGR